MTKTIRNSAIDQARSESKMTVTIKGRTVTFRTWDGKTWEGSKSELQTYKRNGWKES